MFKPKGSKNRTGIDETEVLKRVMKGLQRGDRAYIYHCYNHYMVPVGFEEMPSKPELAYKKDLSPDQVETFLLIADNSRKHQTFHSIRWSDIL